MEETAFTIVEFRQGYHSLCCQRLTETGEQSSSHPGGSTLGHPVNSHWSLSVFRYYAKKSEEDESESEESEYSQIDTENIYGRSYDVKWR